MKLCTRQTVPRYDHPDSIGFLDSEFDALYNGAVMTENPRPTSARQRLEEAINCIADPSKEGMKACLTVYSLGAQCEAEEADKRVGVHRGPLDGTLISIKDLFDIAGEVTRAGSRVLSDEGRPATADALVIARLRAAGAVIVAKTNMSEYAFSGVGLNPHFGTPGNPVDRKRVPGGSTSGGAVAVADGMCEIAIGTDTGGSTRIPAALCGIVGWKPSKQRILTLGTFPLSTTFDSIGVMARTVAECAGADAVMSGESLYPLKPAALGGLKLGIPQGLPLTQLDDAVTRAFMDGIKCLDRAGAIVSEETFPQFDAMLEVANMGGIVPAEAFALHRECLARHKANIDPNVAVRIERGGQISATDYTRMLERRQYLVRDMDSRLIGLDALVLPTTAIVAPTFAQVSTPEGFSAHNALLLRNTSLGNFFNLCAISLPLPVGTALPVGLLSLIHI